MSIYGKWLPVIIADEGTISAEVNLGLDYDYLEVQIPTLDTCDVGIQTSMTAGGTYQDLSSVVEAVGTGAYNDVWYLGGWQFIKLESSETQSTAAVTFYVRGMRY